MFRKNWYYLIVFIALASLISACQGSTSESKDSAISPDSPHSSMDFPPAPGVGASQEASVARQLTGRWNMVSFPIVENTEISSVVSQYPGIRSVWSWNHDQQLWSVFPQLSNFPLLETLSPEKGYWLNIDNEINMTGTGMTAPAYDLNAGWNFVAVSHSEDALGIADFLTQSNLWGNACAPSQTVNSVWAWVGQAWHVYMPVAGQLDALNSENGSDLAALSQLEKGIGIWINASMGNDATSLASCEEPEPVTCEEDMTFFEETVWTPVLSGSCIACHAEGGFASQQGSRLELRGNSMAQYLSFNFEKTQIVSAAESESGMSLLLAKPTGQVAHGGGTQMQTGSSSYRALEVMVERFAQSSCFSSNNEEDQSALRLPAVFDRVTLASAEETLEKAAMVLGARLPTEEEVSQVQNNGEGALPAILDQLMTESVFYDHLKDIYNDTLLTDRYIGFGAYVLPEWVYPDALWFQDFEVEGGGFSEELWYNTNYGVGREPLELIAHVVRENRPFTEILTADYLMVNPYSARSYGIEDLAFKDTDDAELRPLDVFQEARLPGVPLSGILTSAMFLDRFPTTDSNRNRGRSRMVLKTFLDTDILKIAQQPVDTTKTAFGNPTMDDPQCQVCHQVIDPIAGTFKNWWEPAYENNWWYEDMRSPGFSETDLVPESDQHKSLQWLAQRIVTDPRFALVTVKTMYRGFVRKELLLRPSGIEDPLYDEKLNMYLVQDAFLTELQQDFIESNYDLKTVIKGIVLSRYFRESNVTDAVTSTDAELLSDVGMEKPLTPEQLDRKIQTLMGHQWGRYGGNNLTEEWRYRLLYGGINSDTITDRITETNGVMAGVQQRMANEMSCMMIPYEFSFMDQNERILFPYADLSMEPETSTGMENQVSQAAIKQNIQYLVKRLWSTDMPAEDVELERIYQLFVDVWKDGKRGVNAGDYSADLHWACNAYVFPQEIWSTVPWNERLTSDPLYTARAWVAVMTYLLMDYQFLYE